MSCLYADIGMALHTYALRHCNNEEGVCLCLHVKSHPLKKCINISLYIYTQNVYTNTEYIEKPHTLTHLKQWLIHNSANCFRKEQSA